jgi:hypothetical protein
VLRRAVCLAGFALGLLVVSCASRDSGGKAPLPRPPANPPFAPYTPAQPLEPGPGGSASRDVFRVETGRGFTVQIRDYLAPLDRAVTIDFGGAAMVEVRTGGGEVTIGTATQKVAQGAVFTVGDTQSAQVTARGEPMLLRAWIYR